MLARDARFQKVMGEGKEISFMNMKLVNTMYGCIDDWLTNCKLSSEPCKNGGYTKKDCSCACPLGTTGANCENLVMSYNDALIQKLTPHSANITKPGEVTSPGYPKFIRLGVIGSTQVIRADKCQRAVVTFQDFQLDDDCDFSYLEIRTDVSVAEGKKYCGTTIAKGTVFKSDKSELIFHYMNKDAEKPDAGYKATFTTEAIPNCA
ncbi:blastula protease 10-like [Hyalella azteca]|uniref:Blastula protease 10-like n=1 Tax=Hyalella azteca TaxID=294128 RepID=A0A8B7NVV8_HYAAZ|nr:blastula protease 10-like [Hyalella azteca]